MMRKLNNKKGITLVEVIVVLIIMAVLSGILVASYTGYIDKAKDDAALVEARAVYLAATTVYHELYAVDPSTTGSMKDDDIAEVEVLAGIKADSIDSITVSSADKKVTAITFTASNGKTCTYNGTSWTVGATAGTTATTTATPTPTP
jgi:prepilin-type N-terminal cleavage/methylation domain-containing protein